MANQTDVLKALSTKGEAVGRGLLAAELSSTDATVRALLHKSHIRVVIGKEGVAVIAISELARKYEVTVPEIILVAQ